MNTTIDHIIPTNTGGVATSWSITAGALPAGLSLNTSSGEITGTLTDVYNGSLVSIQASNPSGHDIAVLSFTVFSENISSNSNTSLDPDNSDDIITDSPQNGLDDDDQVAETLPSDQEIDSESGSQFLSLIKNNLVYLIILTILVVALVVVSRGRTDPAPFTQEFKAALNDLQGKISDDDLPLYQTNEKYRFLVDKSTESLESVRSFHRSSDLHGLLAEMKTDVYREKGAVIYCRAISTILSVNYRAFIKENSKASLRLIGRPTGRNISRAIAVEKRKNYENLRTNLNHNIEQEFFQRLWDEHKFWDKIMHPEAYSKEDRNFSTENLWLGLNLIRKYIGLIVDIERRESLNHKISQYSSKRIQ